MNIDQLNSLNKDESIEQFTNCCAAHRWVEKMSSSRPFSSVEQVREAVLSGLNAKAKANFPSVEQVKDWIRLIETHLMSELWFKRPTHQASLVERSKLKFREIQSMTKNIARRDEGMKNKTLQFHGYVHAS